MTYVNQTFFPGAIDLFLDRMRADLLFPRTAAPTVAVNGRVQHGGDVASGNELTIEGEGEIYFTLDGSDPRKTDGDVHGQLFQAALPLAGDVTVNARAQVSGEWSPLLTATFTALGPTGDVNNDFQVDSQDIDTLFAAIASGNTESKLDLNQDGSVTELGSDYLIESILDTRRGDFDLDGKVNFADFLILSSNFGQQGNATWEQGDADGDARISFADFLLLSTNYGFPR